MDLAGLSKYWKNTWNPFRGGYGALKNRVFMSSQPHKDRRCLPWRVRLAHSPGEAFRWCCVRNFGAGRSAAWRSTLFQAVRRLLRVFPPGCGPVSADATTHDHCSTPSSWQKNGLSLENNWSRSAAHGSGRHLRPHVRPHCANAVAVSCRCVGEMAGCALWMPLPAGKVLPPAPQVGLASGRGPSDLSTL